jgi:SAM-dependent methyltransferase
MTSTYDRIGATYAATRRPDPRIAGRILAALGDATSVVHVGAGAGSYEPTDRVVVGVEPSATMIRQRAQGSARVVPAMAEALPFADGAFESALAVLTVHHWRDMARGLGEVQRVARRRAVVLTWDQDVWESFWLIRDYLPCIRDLDRPRAIPLRDLVSALGGGRVRSVPIPHDCVDGIHGAFWRRPEAYLDPRVRAGLSTYALMSAADRDRGLRALAADLESGAWRARHGDLLERDELDLGYRLVVAEW